MARSMRRLAAVGFTAAAVAVLTATPASASTVTVSASASGGVATIVVSAGDELIITASGTAGYGYEGASDCTGYPTTDPNGNRTVVVNGVTVSCQPKYGTDNTLSSAPVGELIARIGAGPWFAVGSSYDEIVSTSGAVYLAYNDSIYGDNTGSYSATVSNLGGGGGGGGGGGTGCSPSPCKY